MDLTDPATRWQRFLARFYAGPNELRLTGENRPLQDLTAKAYAAWMATTPTPFFLPAKIGDQSCCYVPCVSGDHRIWVRDVIRAYLGSWIVFDELDSAPTGSPMDDVVAELIGPQGCRYVFSFPSVGDAPRHVIEGIRRLTDALARRPIRHVELNRTPGRLIGEFWDACAAGSEDAARDLLDTLTGDPRLSRINALFLRVQALATFERWDQIERLEQLDDLLRMQRPTRVSDALARLAMARLPSEATLTDFDQHKARYGALVESVTAIKSAAGAQYYAYWSLSAGESAAAVRGRLLDGGWLDKVQRNSLLNALLAQPEPPPPPAPRQLDRQALNAALADGRLDAAIALMAAATPTTEALPILNDLVLRTLSPDALTVLQDWRHALGADAPAPNAPGLLVDEKTAQPVYTNIDAAISDALSATTTAEQRQQAMTACRDLAVTALMRPDALGEFVTRTRELTASIDFAAGDVVDLLLDIERDLYAAGGDYPGMQDLRMLAVETWAYSDETGDRQRLSRVVVLVDRMLNSGLSVAAYDELVDLLRGAWKPFLTDSDTPLGLETIEVLASHKPDSTATLNGFALPVLSRIGDHNIHRLEPRTFDVARLLASEFHLDIAFPPHSAFPPQSITGMEYQASQKLSEPPSGTFIAIYSLMESAAQRTKQLLNNRYPDVRVAVFNDKVATEPLRSAGRLADIVVIADRAAAHAATGALVDARAGRPVDYARGKGTASLLDAVDRGIHRLMASSA